jgi:hypothetical protein
MRTLLKECVRQCSPGPNVRRDVRLVADKWQICSLFEVGDVRSCSRTSEQMFARSSVRLWALPKAHNQNEDAHLECVSTFETCEYLR